jgi:histidinol-phosphate aminotransferase
LKALEFLRPAILGLHAYEAEPLSDTIPLDANENPYGPPAAFMEDATQLFRAARLNRYPDPTCRELLRAASAYYGVPANCLLPGNGSDEWIASLFVAFGGEARKCLVASPSFSMYALCAKAAGWEVLEEALDGSWGLGESFLARAKKEKPSLIVLGSPNNPTGNCFDPEVLDALLGLDSVLVLDEAYIEFSGGSRIAEVLKRPNLIVLRTLSKAFGLAGLRIGFLAAHPELVSQLNKVRLPYNIDQLAQALAGLALKRQADFAPSLEAIQKDKARLANALADLPGIILYPSDANFFLFRLPGSEVFHRHMLERGLRLRRFQGGRLEGCLRICVGSSEEMDICFSAFEGWKP